MFYQPTGGQQLGAIMLSIVVLFILGIGGWYMGDMKSELRRVGLVPKKKPPSKRTEPLSERDLKDLMGINKPTYKRGSGGAWKQR